MEEKFAYWFDKNTREYKGLRKRQFHNGQYLMPGSCTLIKPPDTETGYVALFENNEWRIYADCRGKIYYDVNTKAEYICQIIDFDPGDEFTDKKPPDEEKYTKVVWDGKDWKIIDTKPDDETLRREWCSTEIRAVYNISAEMRLINIGIQEPNNTEYIEYRNKVDEIKIESHKNKKRVKYDSKNKKYNNIPD